MSEPITTTATPAPVWEVLSAEETALARRVEDSFLRRMESIENAEVLFEKRTLLLESAHRIALRRTRPEDWVLFKDRSGAETAMLTASGADLVADVFGIQIANIRPLDHRGVFSPEKEPIPGKTGTYTLRAWCDARSNMTGREVLSLEASRRSDEDFTGRSVDSDGALVTRGVGALESDLRAAVQTLLRTKAVRVLCGMTRVPVSDLADAWKGTSKDVSKCRRGSGYGSGQQRVAENVAEEGVTAKAEALWKRILQAVGGDVEAAGQVLREITSYPAYTRKSDGKAMNGFAGVKSYSELTTSKHVENATRKLESHPLFNHAEREPGE